MPLSNPTLAGVTTSGSYTGTSAANRAIPHGLGYTPKLVVVYEDRGVEIAQFGILCTGFDKFDYCQAANLVGLSGAVTAATNTNFYVGNAGDYVGSFNYTGYTYYWIAFY